MSATMKRKILNELMHLIKKKDFSEAQEFVKQHFPSGSGFNAGTQLRGGNSKRLTFTTAFHHMDDAGFYDGWTEHQVFIDAHLEYGFTVTVTGKNRNDIKNYIQDVFIETLQKTIEIPVQI